MIKALFAAFLLFFTFSFAANAQVNQIESRKTLGTYQYFQKNGVKLNNKQVQLKMAPGSEAYRLMQSARSNNTIAGIFSFIGGGLIGWQFGTALGGGEPNWSMAGVGAGFVAVGIPFNTAFNKKSQQAVQLYNAGLTNGSSYRQPEIKLGFAGTGLGLQLRF